MVKSTIYKGIEFVRVSQLTKQEQEIFNRNFNGNALIKILVDEEIIHDCIQYKDYILWHKIAFPQETRETENLKKKSDPIRETVGVH